MLAVVVPPHTMKAQRGGDALYMLLHLTQSSKVASLGGNQVGLPASDLSMLLHNPGLLDSAFSKQVSLSYVPYLADISYGYGGGALHFSKVGTFALGFSHIGYGEMTAADESGVITGTFTAGETMIQASFSRMLYGRIRAGISVKPVISRIESYDSWGIAGDMGVFYTDSSGLFTAGLVLRNFGRQITSYGQAEVESLPADLQAGLSFKPAHAPFRISLTAQDLLSGSLDYELNDDEGSDIRRDYDKASDLEKVLRHFTLGLEFMPSQNFYVAGGVNPRRRIDMKTQSKASTVGYTWGFGFRVYKFHFSYASGRYHLAGTSNHFTISTNLSSF